MQKTFATMKTEVGNNVQDTSSGLATMIGIWLNNAYLKGLQSCLWSKLINFTYTGTMGIGTATYNLPTDFEEELFVANVTTGTKLSRVSEGEWFRDNYHRYSSGTLSTGTPDTYLILRGAGTTGVGQIMLDPPPDKADVFGMPYKKIGTALSGTGDTVLVTDLENYMIWHATGEALAYKKQFQTSEYFLEKAQLELQRLVKRERFDVNQNKQFIPASKEAYVEVNRWDSGNNPY